MKRIWMRQEKLRIKGIPDSFIAKGYETCACAPKVCDSDASTKLVAALSDGPCAAPAAVAGSAFCVLRIRQAYGGFGPAWQALTRRMRRLLKPQWVTPEFEDAVKYVQQLLVDLETETARSKGAEVLTAPRFPLLLNVALLKAAQESASAGTQRASERLPAAPDKVAEILRYMRYASSAYGVVCAMALSVGNLPAFRTLDLRETDLDFVVKHCRLRGRQDIFGANLHADEAAFHCPRHFVAVDHANRQVVLVIRGTLDAKDALTDLVCRTTPFCGGLAHEGIVKGARAVLASALPTVRGLLARRECAGYSFAVTGHSLGGGTAILVTLSLLTAASAEENIVAKMSALPAGTPLHCYAFGPPPVFCGRLPEAAARCITVIAHNEDCVPRLSLASVTQLILTLQAVDDVDISTRQRTLAVIEPNKNLEGVKKIQAAMQHASRQQLADPLHHAGTLYHVVPEDQNSGDRHSPHQGCPICCM
ncbi:hypothetical protein CYMTET_18389 [Cymbomonas tetramitiformis]|uniref:sn-1-specific diacylglycerol lipase n=1 Tax=Cymbomonas tetramitiformis TaxID=36881 RepID=A0AAE0G9I4_9CHLO|nr:hypothetical protein CYMTET_18389 [Cymbomonas tetramitiformis]